jgi:tetratricopeptide (TPR) repeat protein
LDEFRAKIESILNSFRSILLALTCFLSLTGSHGVPQKGPTSFDELAQKANQASKENRLADAADLYRRALALRSGWAEGWWALGTLQYDQNQYAAAAAAFRKLIVLQPENGTAKAMLGLCQVELDQDDAALKNLSLAQQQGVQNDRQLQHVVLYQLGRVQLRKRKFGDAMDTMTLLLKDGVRSQEVVTALGMAALTVQPQNAPALGTAGREVIDRAGRGQMLAILKDFSAAKETFTLLATEYPAYPNLHFAFGRVYLDAHETDEAIAEFQKELQQNPKHVGALLEIAAVRYRVDSGAGVKYAEQAVKLSPQLPFSHYLLGLLYLDVGKASEALPELQIAQKAFPKEAQVYFALGNAYAKLGRKEEAARMRAEFIRLNADEKAQKEASDSGIYGHQSSSVLTEKLQQQSAPPPR